MAVFVNDGAFLTVGAIPYKKEKSTTVAKGDDGDIVVVAFDDGQRATFSLKEHGADNGQSDIDAFLSFIKGFFSTTGGSGGGGGAAGDVTVLNRRGVTTTTVKATATAGGINNGDQFILEVTTDNNGNKTYAGITAAGRTTTIPAWTSEISTSTDKPSGSQKVSVPANAASTTLLAANNNRVSTIIYNDSANDEILYVSKVSPATTSDAIRLEKGGYVIIDNYTQAIYGIWSSANLGNARIEFTEL